MNRYAIEVLVRPDDEEGPERPIKTRVTAGTVEDACRETCHQANHDCQLVSRFISVHKLPTPKGLI